MKIFNVPQRGRIFLASLFSGISISEYFTPYGKRRILCSTGIDILSVNNTAQFDAVAGDVVHLCNEIKAIFVPYRKMTDTEMAEQRKLYNENGCECEYLPELILDESNRIEI